MKAMNADESSFWGSAFIRIPLHEAVSGKAESDERGIATCFRIAGLSHGESLVFGCFHNLAFAGAFVVDAAKVENAVNNGAVQFVLISGVELFGICFYRVETDKQITG